MGKRDWNRSSVDWSMCESTPDNSIESQVYIDGGWDALRAYRHRMKREVTVTRFLLRESED